MHTDRYTCFVSQKFNEQLKNELSDWSSRAPAHTLTFRTIETKWKKKYHADEKHFNIDQLNSKMRTYSNRTTGMENSNHFHYISFFSYLWNGLHCCIRALCVQRESFSRNARYLFRLMLEVMKMKMKNKHYTQAARCIISWRFILHVVLIAIVLWMLFDTRLSLVW